MFVDRNHASRKVLSEVLRNHGLTVLEASDLPEALLADRDYSGPIDLLIAESEGGAKIVERLGGKNPRMRTIFTGSAAEHATAGKHAHAVKAAFLERPFDAPVLLAAVLREVRPLR